MSLDIDIPMIAVVRACSREFREVEESYRKRISKKKEDDDDTKQECTK